MGDYEAGEHGQYASRPLAIPMRGWGNVSRRVIAQLSEDNLSIVAAGIAFYGLLAAFPAIAAFVTLYGLATDPTTVREQLAPLRGLIPSDGYDILADQLHAVAAQGRASLGVGLAFSLALTLWSAMSGIKTLMTALNIAYEERERRGFMSLNAMALLFTLGAMLLMALSLVAIAAIPAMIEVLALPDLVAGLLMWTRWLAMAGFAVIGLAILYRYGPDRRPARWRWLMPGAIAATLLWVGASALFSFYVTNFGSYNETFGSLAAVVILLMWFFLSAYAICLGAELNAALERQTSRDTTIGPSKPRGRRGAYVADHPATYDGANQR